MSAAPSDQDLIEALGERVGGRRIAGLSRRPYIYATSAPLEEVRVQTEGGEEVALILKDLVRDRLIGDARATKPAFLHEPNREVAAYAHILGPAGVGPSCLASSADAQTDRHWLLLEKVPGVELWQVGELPVWEGAARWLGGFHARFADRLDELRVLNPYLLEHSDVWFRTWWERALGALAGSTDPRAPKLMRALEGGELTEGIAALPRTFVHGEFYPSNVLVDRATDPDRICPVDWEMAAIGPGLIDLAALGGGWEEAERRRLVDAYLKGLEDAGDGRHDRGRLDDDLARCRLHLALQWLGWSTVWTPPREHAHDWLGEALALTVELRMA